MTKKLKAIVEKGKGERNFACFTLEDVGRFGINGVGNTAREAMDDLRVAADECKKLAEAEGEEWPELEFEFIFDLGSFFDYFPLNASAFAKRIGINPAQFRQYLIAAKEPRQGTLEKIHAGMRELLKDMGTVPLIEKPVTSYI